MTNLMSIEEAFIAPNKLITCERARPHIIMHMSMRMPVNCLPSILISNIFFLISLKSLAEQATLQSSASCRGIFNAEGVVTAIS